MNHHGGHQETSRRNTAKRWTAEEDARLRELVIGSGEEAISWVDVSRHLSGRSNKDSRRRWTKIKDSFRRGVWSREEDESLRVAVERFGQRWALVTEVVETRSPDQEECQKRWRNALDPKISGTVSWSSEEDQRLRDAVFEMGKNWSHISDRHFPNRSPLSLSNRYAALEQHSSNAMPSTTEPQPLTLPAVEKSPKSPPPQNNTSVTESTTRSLETSNTLIAPTLADVLENLPFDVGGALLGSGLQFTDQDVHYISAEDSMVTPELDAPFSVNTTPPQECIPCPVTILPSNTPTISPDFEIATPSYSGLRFQEVNLFSPSMSQASSCVPPPQSPSGAASSVLVLENLDDETRDAVLRLIWSKRKRTTLRLE